MLHGLNHHKWGNNMNLYISLEQTHFAVYWALAGVLTYYVGLLPADRKINTTRSSLGQPLSRIHHDSRQQPEVVSTMPDLVHLPRGDGSPFLILPESVQLCGAKPTQRKSEGWSKCLASWKLAAGVFHRTKSFSGFAIKVKIIFGSLLLLCRSSSKQGEWVFFFILVVSFMLFRLLSDLFGKLNKLFSTFHLFLLICKGFSGIFI